MQTCFLYALGKHQQSGGLLICPSKHLWAPRSMPGKQLQFNGSRHKAMALPMSAPENVLDFALLILDLKHWGAKI